MSFPNDQDRLPLIGGVVQSQRLVVPHQVIARIKTYRQACRFSYLLARRRGITQSVLCLVAPELYKPHVSDYFSRHPKRRELPARHIGIVQEVFGNTVIAQWVAAQCELHLLEEMQAYRQASTKAA